MLLLFLQLLGVTDINSPTVVAGIFIVHFPALLFHVPKSVGLPILVVSVAASNHTTVSSLASYVFIGAIITVSPFAIPIFILSGVVDVILFPVVCVTIIPSIAWRD